MTNVYHVEWRCHACKTWQETAPGQISCHECGSLHSIDVGKNELLIDAKKFQAETDAEICGTCGLRYDEHDGREFHQFSRVRPG